MKRLFHIILFLLVVYNNNLSAYSGWQKNTAVSFLTGNNKYPDIIVSGSKMYTCWITYKKNIPYIYYSVYENKRWSKPLNVAEIKKFKILYPSVNIFNNTAYIAYSDIENKLNIVKIRDKDISHTKFSNIKNILMPQLKIINNKLYVFYERNINAEMFNINYAEIGGLTNKESTFISKLSTRHGFFFPKIKAYNGEIYTLWINRMGKGNNRYDKLLLKSNNNTLVESHGVKYLSADKEDVIYADFYIKNNKLFTAYIKKQIIKSELAYTLQFKIFSLDDFQVINKSETNLTLNNYYKVQVNFFKGKFYLFFYRYKNNRADIYYSTSENFLSWEKPLKITQKGRKNRNFKVVLTSEKNLGILYEKEYKNKSVIFFKNKDNICEPPIVYSTTHKSNKWSYYKKVILKWKAKFDDSGIKGYSYIIDNNINTVPDVINLSAGKKSLVYIVPSNGIYYFHIRAVDNVGNWSSTAAYKFMVNSDVPDAPIISSPTHKEFIPSDNLSPVFKWDMKDNREIRGYSYLLTQNEDDVPNSRINIRAKIKKYKNISPGVWYFKIKACDFLGRWTDYSSFTINIEKILIASGVSEDVKSRYTYTVGNGETLVSIINKVLQLTNSLEYRNYIKGVANFNYLQNYDYLKPGDKIMFPIILARPGDTKKKIAKSLFGDEAYSGLVVIIDKPNEKIVAGDKIIVKDRYFLETGDVNKNLAQ